MAFRGKILLAGCMLLAIITAWLWIHSSVTSSDDGLTNFNTLVLRRWGIAIGSWRGRFAIGHMDNPKYEYWNKVPPLSDPHCSGMSFFGGMVDYQACDDGSAAWDWDFNYPTKWTSFGSAWQFAGFAYADHTVSHDLDLPGNAWPIPISVQTVCFAVPDYLIILLLLIYPAVWFRRKRMVSHRLKVGLCVKCGYDLRGGHAACPECGLPVGSAQTGTQRPSLR